MTGFLNGFQFYEVVGFHKIKYIHNKTSGKQKNHQVAKGYIRFQQCVTVLVMTVHLVPHVNKEHRLKILRNTILGQAKTQKRSENKSIMSVHLEDTTPQT